MRAKLAAAGFGDLVVVDSAGTAGWHEGDDADPRARRTLQAAGYPLRHRARQFRRDWFSRTDLILAMDEANAADLRVMARGLGITPGKIRLLMSFDLHATNTEVPDPYYGGDEGFADVLRMVESAAEGVVEHVARQLSQS